MTIRASCGHLIQNSMLGVPLKSKEYDREGNKSVRFGVYCDHCALELEREGEVLKNDIEEREWIESDRL